MWWNLLFLSLLGTSVSDNTCKSVTRDPDKSCDCETRDQDKSCDCVTRVLYKPRDSGANVPQKPCESDGEWSPVKYSMVLCGHDGYKIDLQGIYKISKVSVCYKKKTEACVTNLQIYIGNHRDDKGTQCRSDNSNNKKEFKCDNAVSGRFINVSSQAKESCSYGVKIWAKEKESPFKLINESKTWEDALYHCRDNNSDLASIRDDEDQAWAELLAEKADTPFVWLGLHYTCTLGFWFWVDDHHMTFTHWAPDQNRDQCDKCDTSVAMDRNYDHRWFIKSVYDKFNFICRVK